MPPRTFPLILLLLAGCSTTIVPPAAPVDPVTVFLVDYGRHTSLVLPREADLVEYAYGEWDWFARGREGWLDAPPALLWPTRGTLGRRTLGVEADAVAVAAAIPGESVSAIIVGDAARRRLLADLDQRFARREADAVYNERHGLTFVPDEAGFHLLHNCNSETARWLETLGCEVRGSRMLADFRIVGR